MTVETSTDGRWRLPGESWIGADGRPCAAPEENMPVFFSRTVLSACHRDHREANPSVTDLLCLCRRCHLLNDREWHHQERMITLRSRYAIGDLFGRLGGPWPSRYGR